eukprot:1248488-Rhodomonas_salina.1
MDPMSGTAIQSPYRGPMRCPVLTPYTSSYISLRTLYAFSGTDVSLFLPLYSLRSVRVWTPGASPGPSVSQYDVEDGNDGPAAIYGDESAIYVSMTWRMGMMDRWSSFAIYGKIAAVDGVETIMENGDDGALAKQPEPPPFMEDFFSCRLLQF